MIVQKNHKTEPTFRGLNHGVSLIAMTAVLLASPGLALAQDAPAPQSPQPEAQAEGGAPPAAAAAPAPAPVIPGSETALIASVRVEGNVRIDSETIISYMPVQAGQTVNSAMLDEAVKTLYRTELFSDVQIVVQGRELVVTVIESPIINQVVFEGNRAMSKDKLREEVQIRPRGVFTKAKVQDDATRIIELYRKSGRIAASVTPKIVELPQNRVDLIFEIDEGAKTGVAAVNFIGNEAFSDGELNSVIVTKKSTWWQFFSSNDNYDPDRMAYDREQLRKHYTNRGYYDFRVVSAVAELTPSRDDFVITYTIDEGRRYNFGRINIRTDNDKLKAENLMRTLSIRPGDLYEGERVEKAVDSLTYTAGAAGYAFVEIRPSEEANPETGLVDITFNIREGERSYIDKINIVGNTQTLDRVIRRKVLLAEGDAYNKALIERSRMQLMGLGYFKDVKVEEKPSALAGKTNIDVTVEEVPTGELTFGAGFSSIEQFILDIGVAQSNFRGTGQDIRARIQTGSIQKNIDFSFTEPYFMNRNVSAGFDIFSSSYSYRYVSYKMESSGIGFRLGYSLNGYALLRLRYNLRKDYISSLDSFCTGSQGFDYCSNGVTSSVGYTLSFDRRNDYIAPTRGWTVLLRQDFAGLGGNVNYIRSEIEAHWYHGFKKDMVLHVYGSAGSINAWNGDAIRVNDRFYKGGDTMRGFEYAGIGPRQLATSGYNYALGGQTYAIGTAELSIPNGLPEQYGVKTALFIEAGTLGGLDRQLKYDENGNRLTNIVDSFAPRATAGLTIRWKSPMGPIQFDLSQVLLREDYDRVETFRFSQSTQF